MISITQNIQKTNKKIHIYDPPSLLPWQNNESRKVTPLILSAEGQNNVSFLITFHGGGGVPPLWKIPPYLLIFFIETFPNFF